MRKRTTVTVALVALAGIGLMVWGQPDGHSTHSPGLFQAKSSLVASEDTFDFGVISMRQGNVAHVFRVASSEDIAIDRLSTSCMCTTAFIADGSSRAGPFGMHGMGLGTQVNTIFRAGETKDIEVVFDPKAHGPAGLGPMDRYVFITDANGGVLQLRIKGLVRP